MGATHAADPLVQLLEVLRKRGSITEAEYQELKKTADQSPASPQFKSLEERLTNSQTSLTSWTPISLRKRA